MRYVAIMAGGSGTRLWPLSRKGMPKQMLPLVDGRSLLRLAYERARLVVPSERVFVVTGAAYADEAAALLPEVPRANVFGEPVGRDSLNAATWPAAVVAARDPEAVVAQLTADHVIEPVDAFARTLTTAFDVAETDPHALVTLGVVPTSPHTGYGYIHKGAAMPGFANAYRALGFTEKPALDVATAYLASGEYWWNSGMFVWRAATFLDQVRQLKPEAYAGAVELAAHPDRLPDIFPALPKVSIDYAVMEPVARGQTDAHVVTVALDAAWSDVGGYPTLAALYPSDESGNATSGRAVCLDARDTVVINTDPDGVVAILGVDGLVVVRTPQATLVMPADKAERVKELVEEVVSRHGTDFA